MTDFYHQVVCVTGASRGIGKAVALGFLARGADVLLLARSFSPKDRTPNGYPADASDRIMARRCNVTDFWQVSRCVDGALGRWARIDVLVNAAAVLGSTGPLWESDPAAWRDAINVNLIGTYNTMRCVLPAMVAAGRGKIVNFAGGGAAYGYPLFGAYAASKVAVVRLTETVALEARSHGVQANAIAPGAIETDMLRQVRAVGGEVRTVGTVERAVKLVLFLASPASGHVTGRFIHAGDHYEEIPVDAPPDLFTLRRVQP